MKILVVDDNRSSAEAMSRILIKQGHDVRRLYDGASAIAALSEFRPELVFTDLKMEPVDGMEVTRAARSCNPPIEVVVFTAFGAVEKAVEAMQVGARDFLTKPISVEQILERVASLHEDAGTVAEATTVDQGLLTTLETLADVPSPVWIEGEVGSGRHRAAVKLADLANLTQVHLFDPRMRDWPDQGMVIVPDVDDLLADDQQRLNRMLRRVPQNVRLVATARPGSQEKITNGTLRSDLYFSLAVVVVQLAPLRERRDELVALFQNALNESCAKYGRVVPTLTDEDLRSLVAYDWPGNVKELRNLAERTAVLGRDGFALQSPAPAAGNEMNVAMFTNGFRLSDHLEGIEAKLLALALEAAGGDRTAAGKLLGVERNTLRYKLKKYGLLS